MLKISQSLNRIDLPRLYSQVNRATGSQIAITLVALAALAITAKLLYNFASKHLDKKSCFVLLVALLTAAELVRRNFKSIKNNQIAAQCKTYVSSDNGLRKDVMQIVRGVQSKVGELLGGKAATRTNMTLNTNPRICQVLHMSKL